MASAAVNERTARFIWCLPSCAGLTRASMLTCRSGKHCARMQACLQYGLPGQARQ
jgi:hypothetical protein